MSQVPRSELAGILFQEIGGYLPEIDNGITILQNSSADQETLTEMHRLFHNIKGAASQVAFTGLSNSAAICEAVIAELLESSNTPGHTQLEFLGQVNDQLRVFCTLDHKSVQAEESLFSNTVAFFKNLLDTSGPDNPIILPNHICALLSAGDASFSDTEILQNHADPDQASLRGECLASLRSIIPLLQELTVCSPQTGTAIFPLNILDPIQTAFHTLVQCSQTAGLGAQKELLSAFLQIIDAFRRSPSLIDASTAGLLQEFFTYLELIFSLPPGDGGKVTLAVQVHLARIGDLLRDQPAVPSAALSEEAVHSPEEDGADTTLELAAIENDFFKELLGSESQESIETDPYPSAYLELLTIFHDECSEHLREISTDLEKLQLSYWEGSEKSDNQQKALHRMLVQAHTLKGAAAMTGFDEIAAVALSLENLFRWLHEESQHLLATDLAVIEDVVALLLGLSKNITEQKTDTLPPAASEIIQEYLKSRKRVSGQHDSKPAELLACEQTTLTFHETDTLTVADYCTEITEIPQQYSAPVESLSYLAPDDASGADYSPEEYSEEELLLPEFAPEQELQEEELELLAIFQSECDEHLLGINEELNTLTSAVRTKVRLTPLLREVISRMRRGVHTLKGAAAMTGFEALAGCAHALEDLLDWLHDDAPDIVPPDVSVIAEAIDIIELLSQLPKNDETVSAQPISAQIGEHITARTAAIVPDEQQPVQPEPPQIFRKVPAVPLKDETVLPADTGNIRVKLGDLEEIVNIEGELVVARGSIEKLLVRFSQSLDELNTIKDTLRRKSQELETGFEAQSLYGFGPGSRLTMDGLPAASGLSEFDPIELDRYSQLNLIIRSLNELSIDVNAIHSEMTTLGTSLQGQVAKQQLAMGLMQEKLMRIRMTPLSSISRVLFRTVRQTAKRLNKDVQLKVTGEDIQMDRFIWTKTIDPLLHILRNCIDHGIEDEAGRLAAAKPSSGQITLEAVQRGRTVVLKISDDGQGIDIEGLRRKLIRENLLSAGNSLSDEELLPYLFRPSVSTREDISQVSGRGVGLDVVLRNIQELRGKVQIINSPGKGVAFELNIPTTLSVNRAVIVGLGPHQFAVPIQDITEVRKFRGEEILPGEEPEVQWNGKPIALIELARYLQAPGSLHPRGSTDSCLTLVVDNGKEHIALAIDRVEEQREIVIKDLGSHLRYVRGISGVTLTGEGTIIPILNLGELTAARPSAVPAATPVREAPENLETRPFKVLVVDDSISVRYSITRLVGSQSWQAYQAVDGLDALEKLESLTPDVIILDIEMPRMNGYEFMSILRNRSEHSSTPVIMLTSRASDKHRRKAEELGVNHYLTKPFQEEDFIQLLSAFKASRS